MAGSHSWLFDLVAPDDGVRHPALGWHQALLAGASVALDRSNRIWARTGTAAPTKPHLAAAMEQARAEFRSHREQTILGPIIAYGDETASPEDRRVLARYLVLYLRWEMDYPQEWDAPDSWMWSRWGTKEGVLYRLDRDGVPGRDRPEVRDLIVRALERPYRCKDWMYAPLIRHVLDAPMVGRIERLADNEDPLVRLRAQFALQVARDPRPTVRRKSWQRWLASRLA